MNKLTTNILLIISVLLNISIIIFLLKSKSDSEKNDNNIVIDKESYQSKAETFVREKICENLYYPSSYDPVKTTIDSVFYNYLTDSDCVLAATKLIDLKSEYSSALNRYNDAVDQIKFFGRTDFGHSHWGKDRDDAKALMTELQEKIEKNKSIIKNRNTLNDDNFIGWQIVHRYRASNSEGKVSIRDILFVVDPDITEYYCRYSLDEDNKYNLKSIRKVIETELGIVNED
ncbi:MAG: hypothetical protein HDS83_04455 [Bacteroidales bacterium]|nr:hypothetical protein [Bacteroidales bacterium]